MSKSDYLEVELLKWCTGQVNALGAAPTPYVALYTTSPSDAGGGVECSYAGYARQSSAGKWAAPSAGSVTTNAAILFPSTATGLTIVAFGLFDAVSAGNLLRWATLTSSRTLVAGDAPNWPIGSLVMTED